MSSEALPTPLAIKTAASSLLFSFNNQPVTKNPSCVQADYITVNLLKEKKVTEAT